MKCSSGPESRRVSSASSTVAAATVKSGKFKDLVVGKDAPYDIDYVGLIALRQEYGLLNYLNLFVNLQVRTGRAQELYCETEQPLDVYADGDRLTELTVLVRPYSAATLLRERVTVTDAGPAPAWSRSWNWPNRPGYRTCWTSTSCSGPNGSGPERRTPHRS